MNPAGHRDHLFLVACRVRARLHGAADDSSLTATDPALIAEEPEQRAGV